MNEQSRQTLQAIADHGPISHSELREMFHRDFRWHCQALGRTGHAEPTERGRLHTLWSITALGRMALASNEPAGAVAGPRTGFSADPYTGEKRTHTRPGSDDFLKVPSRRGDSTVEWERPFIICAKVEPVGVRG
jgi:hypothetical protein